eukprot:3750825-Pleurochrysis_carterae.AAC.1
MEVRMGAVPERGAISFEPLSAAAKNAAMVGAPTQASETRNLKRTARGKPDREIHEASDQ